MSSAQRLREFIQQRLTAAAEEIFTEFGKTIVRYEEEIDRQRRLLDISCKPETELHTTEFPQEHVCEEQEVLTGQERNFSLHQEEPSQITEEQVGRCSDQEEPEPLQIIEKQEERCTGQDEEQLLWKEETDTFMVNTTYEERGHTEPEPHSDQLLPHSSDIFNFPGSDSQETQVFNNAVQNKEEDNHQVRVLVYLKPEVRLHRIDFAQLHVYKEQEQEVLTDQQLCNEKRNFSLDQEEPEPPQIAEEQKEVCTSQEGAQRVLKEETDSCLVTAVHEESDRRGPEPKSDHLPPRSPSVAENHHQIGGKNVDSGPTRNLEAKPVKKRKRTRNHSNRHSPTSESQGNTGKNPLTCEVCGKTFKKTSQIKEHCRIHTGEKPHSCITCGRSFTQKSTLLRHMLTHSTERLHSCETCGKTFNQVNNLRRHMRTHTGERPYSCKTCGKSFSQSSNLLAHRRIHTGERPHECKICGKRFSNFSTCRNHMTVHTGEMPYSCQTCGKSFSRANNMQRHMRSHTGERPHLCKTCGKRFSASTSLARHKAIHTGARPYQCQTCGDAFRQRHHLLYHIKTHIQQTSTEKAISGKSNGKGLIQV